MAKKIIKISVNDEYVVGSGVVIGAAGSDKAVALQVSFNDTWAGLNIYATFRDAIGENPTAVMLMPSRLVLGENMAYQIDVPKTATAIAGKMSVVFSGFAVTESSVYDAEGNVYDKLVYRDALINTGNAYFRVIPSDFSVLDTEDKSEPTLFEQVLVEINNLHGAIVERVGSVQNEMAAHEESVAATIGNLGTYEDENGEAVEHTVESRLGVQDEKLEAQDEKLKEQDRAISDFKAAVDKSVEAQDDKIKEQDRKIGAVYNAYNSGELKGEKGEKGEPGKPFTVSKVYNSVAEMNGDFKNEAVEEGGFVVIETGSVDNPENSKLYVKGPKEYKFITDLSGSQGLRYVLTSEDKDEIMRAVIEALPKYTGEVIEL